MPPKVARVITGIYSVVKCCRSRYGRNRSLRQVLLLLGSLLFLLLAHPPQAAANSHAAINRAPINSATIAGYKIKAVYIYRLANFVYWPEKSPRLTRFCAFGNDNVTLALQRLINQSYQDAATFTPLGNIRDARKSCQILYIAKNKLKQLRSIPRYKGTITVSDSSLFLRRGGMVELRTVGNQIKPVISLENVKKSGLTVSSHLLRVALLPPDTKRKKQ